MKMLKRKQAAETGVHVVAIMFMELTMGLQVQKNEYKPQSQLFEDFRKNKYVNICK